MTLPNIIQAAKRPDNMDLWLSSEGKGVRVVIMEATVYQPNRLQAIIGAMARHLAEGKGQTVDASMPCNLAVFDTTTGETTIA